MGGFFKRDLSLHCLHAVLLCFTFSRFLPLHELFFRRFLRFGLGLIRQAAVIDHPQTGCLLFFDGRQFLAFHLVNFGKPALRHRVGQVLVGLNSAGANASETAKN